MGMLDSMADLRGRVDEVLQQQDDSSRTSSLPQRIGLDSSKRVLLPLSFSPFISDR